MVNVNFINAIIRKDILSSSLFSQTALLFNRMKEMVFMIDRDLIETALLSSCINPGPIVTQETIYRNLSIGNNGP